MSMNEQLSLATTGFERCSKTTRRTKFLLEMDRIVPWKRLRQIVRPFYYKGEGVGRRPIELERMLRIYFLQHWFSLSDPAVEEALYDMLSMRAFARIDLGEGGVPDETTICKFRHLLEKHDLGKKLFAEVNRYLADCGITISGGTIVDATIIHAPSSTKNQDGERDPEMHPHIGADSRHKLVHSIVATAANAHDSTILADLLHGNETRVYGDSAYLGKVDVIREKSPRARAFINKRAYRNRPLSDRDRQTNRRKSQIRSRVEHIFGTVKGFFGFKKVRYRGLAKNENCLNVLFALSNLFMVKRNARLSTPFRRDEGENGAEVIPKCRFCRASSINPSIDQTCPNWCNPPRDGSVGVRRPRCLRGREGDTWRHDQASP
jgi:IS5 family transposase